MRELLLGLGLGLGAGIAPGALLSLVITASLRGGFPAGLRIACVPLLSDLPIVLLTVAAVGTLPETFLQVLSLTGGAYVVFLGAQGLWEARKAEPPEPGVGTPAPVLKGVLVNMLNPHPWLFWATVGAPVLVAAWTTAPVRAIAFATGFYLVLVGSKVVLAGLIGAGRHRIGVTGYRILLAGSAVLLTGAGVALIVAGLS
ncbi:LysE family transporter [Acrocarpospora catenulata]|uniref:LysE family transporter n=1 Tax=Acrocarpospora catenulata TaxID=2836182 RepID=UPI001BD98E32|nr:LysE family transporter [Acrocarpospora catenulata]